LIAHRAIGLDLKAHMFDYWS